ncbi:MAG: hypothetical protein MUQ32_02860 [Chloroflexi bacterium]|nr:hypothetical protein [Chloroflexota bacterium]
MPGPRGTRRLLALLAAVVGGALIAGCSLLPSPAPAAPTPPPGAVVVPPARMDLGISNGSTLHVAFVVNGTVVAQVDPGQGETLTAAQLPALPWNVEVRSPSGRELVGMTVRAGDLWTRDNADGSSEAKAAGARVDLSCGRIDIWSLIQMSGPVPGPGVPGDCNP